VGTAAPSASPTTQPSPTVPGSTPVVVELTLTADCWISVTADAGAPRSQLYRAGDRPRFEGTREVRLDIGNAGAVTMTVNGRPARPLGSSGTTARLRNTPENAGEWVR
jgi:cytoskeleton protein RodZ